MKHIDKNSLKHFGVNYILAAIGGLYGVSAGVAASITKEYCDNGYAKHWCWWDILFDFLGIGFGELTHYLIFKSL